MIERGYPVIGHAVPVRPALEGTLANRALGEKSCERIGAPNLRPRTGTAAKQPARRRPEKGQAALSDQLSYA